MSGINFLHDLSEHHHDPVVTTMTAFGDIESTRKAFGMGAGYGCRVCPFLKDE